MIATAVRAEAVGLKPEEIQNLYKHEHYDSVIKEKFKEQGVVVESGVDDGGEEGFCDA